MTRHHWGFLPAALVSLGVLFSPDAGAQTSNVLSRNLTSGLTLPPTTSALVDQATSTQLNPAGLSGINALQLYYLHERDVPQDLVGDGIFLGDQFFDVVGAGFSVQWLRFGSGLPNFRKTAFSLSLGGPTFSFGGSWNLFSSPESADVDRLSTFDFGLQLKPWRYLAFGASVLDFDAPKLAGVQLPRRYLVGAGIRPFTERIELGADFIADDLPSSNLLHMSYAARFAVFDGVVISAGLSHPIGVASSREIVGQLALILNAPHVGFGYAFGSASDLSTGGDHLLQVRLSRGEAPSLLAGSTTWPVLDLHQILTPPASPLLSLSSSDRPEPYLKLLSDLRELSRDRRVGGLVLKIDDLGGLGSARIEELRSAIALLRKSGKRVFAYLMDAEDNDYYLASAAEKIFTVPESTLLINGLSASTVYLGGALEKVGARIDVARVGKYKTAPEQLTQMEMSPAEQEQLGAYLDSVFQNYVTEVAAARKLTPDKFKDALKNGILTPRMAREAGLVDEIVYPDELRDYLEKLTGGRVDLTQGYSDSEPLGSRWGDRPKIAVIPVEGTISGGKSRSDPTGTIETAGAETVIKALHEADEDASVRAVVLRIDSPGGDASASDLIWHAAMQLREHKPVVVSMGDYAASGGYYVAMAGSEIWAEPNTLTGSIGVFAIKPSFGGLLGKVGVNTVTMTRGDRADLFSLSKPWDEGEQKAVQGYVDEFYDHFITKVAQARGLQKAQVDAVAQGRIWSGTAAKDNHLVDKIGGLPEALASARDRAKLAPNADYDIILLGGPKALLGLSLAGQETVPESWRKVLGTVSTALGVPLVELGDGPLALMPYRITVK